MREIYPCDIWIDLLSIHAMIHYTHSNWYWDIRFTYFKNHYRDTRDIENSCEILSLAEHHREYLWDIFDENLSQLCYSLEYQDL